jgi:hypothetical protein
MAIDFFIASSFSLLFLNLLNPLERLRSWGNHVSNPNTGGGFPAGVALEFISRMRTIPSCPATHNAD